MQRYRAIYIPTERLTGYRKTIVYKHGEPWKGTISLPETPQIGTIINIPWLQSALRKRGKETARCTGSGTVTNVEMTHDCEFILLVIKETVELPQS